MKNTLGTARCFNRPRQACGIAALFLLGLGTATAAPYATGTNATRALGPVAAKPNPGVAHAPIARNPDIVADGGGVHIGSAFVAFNSTAAINSTTIIPQPRPPRPERTPSEVCRFIGSFTLRNVGSGSPSDVGVYNFDVYTWVEQPQGPQVGKMADTGYAIPDMKPGTTYSQNFSFDVKPGLYVFYLSIDPYHKLKQATPGTKQYRVQLRTSCGIGAIRQMHTPATP
jgi:hypothetical protein